MSKGVFVWEWVKLNVTQDLKSIFHRIESIVGKRKKLLFSSIFPFFPHNNYDSVFPMGQDCAAKG